MEDADPYNRSKYPTRPVHQRGSSSQHLTRQGSSAAQRYSPMDLLSPSGYGSSPKSQSQNSSFQYQSSAPRQSPTRQNNFANSSQLYQDSPSKSIPCIILSLILYRLCLNGRLTLASQLQRDTKIHTSRQYKVQIWIWIRIIPDQQVCSSLAPKIVKCDLGKPDNKRLGLGRYQDFRKFNPPKSCNQESTCSPLSGVQILREDLSVLVPHT